MDLALAAERHLLAETVRRKRESVVALVTSPSARVLVVEDDVALAGVLCHVLTGEGYSVAAAADGEQAHALLDEVQPELILLDIMLPDTDGLVLCSELRPRSRAPIILLSATKRRTDRILGLKLGADDFIPKPFDIHELVARVEAVLRRSGGSRPAATEQRVGTLVIDQASLIARLGAQPLRLTPTEFRLLAALAARPNHVVSRNELAQAAWGYGDVGQSRAVDVHIRRLRQKLEGVPGPHPDVETVRGFGYKIVSSEGVRG